MKSAASKKNSLARHSNSNSNCNKSQKSISNFSHVKPRDRSSSSARYHSHSSDKSSWTIIGKTSVMALYELCSHRSLGQISFSEEKETNAENEKEKEKGNKFTIAVTIGIGEAATLSGVGKASTKSLARQRAAREAVLRIVPGVVIDGNGMIESVPSDMATEFDNSNSNNNSNNNNNNNNNNSGHISSDSTLSTVSGVSDNYSSYNNRDGYNSSNVVESDNESTMLLYKLWQNDKRIRSPPVFEYEVIVKGFHECTAKIVRHRGGGRRG